MRPVPGKLKERCDQCRTLGGRHIAYTPRIYSTFEQKEQLFQVCQQPLSGPSCYCHAVHVYNHLTGSACLQPSPCGMLTCTLQDVCHLLKQGLNASVILVGPHSSSTLASSRHILCSVADHLSKLPQAANYNIEVAALSSAVRPLTCLAAVMALRSQPQQHPAPVCQSNSTAR